MPVEIRELIIKATVSEENSKSPPSTALVAGNSNQEIIKICIEKVLEIIKEKHGR
jgi:hypothetical protein